MFGLIKKFRREFVYSSYLFLIFELLVTPTFAVNINYFIGLSLIGYVLINLWLFSTYRLYSSKKVSKYSEVVLRVKLWERLFSYVFLPLLFYTSVVAFLLLSSSNLLNQIIIVASVTLFFYLFLYVRTSYEKIYSINRMARIATDFTSIVVFFITTNVLTRVINNEYLLALSIFFLALFSFVYILYHHNKFDGSTAILAILSALCISLVPIIAGIQGIYSTSAILSIIYYLIISIWNVRFSGATTLSEYMPPIMYSIMALILILSL